jgi:hypothetical protein
MRLSDADAAFIRLFEGNEEAYGADEGGCVRGDPPWEAHLAGDTPMGVYPIKVYDPTSPGPLASAFTVQWGCVDLDVKSAKKPSGDYATEKDASVAAWNLVKVLAALDIAAFVERTRSKGRHVWVFADQWVPAAAMRRALIVACKLAEVTTREVNPKQERLDEGQLGNYVRLPYPGVAINHDADRQVMVRPGLHVPYDYETFVADAEASLVSLRTLSDIAQHYVPPLKSEVPTSPVETYTGDLLKLARRLGGRGFVVFKNGPVTGDRSAALQYIAHYAFEGDLTYDQAYTLVEDLDQRVGKYVGRSDREKRLHDIVGRAYGR